MSEQPKSDDDLQPKMAQQHNHNLSWIAMVVMAAMCLLALIYAGTIDLGG